MTRARRVGLRRGAATAGDARPAKSKPRWWRQVRMRRKSAKQAAFEKALEAIRPMILARDGYKCQACGTLPIWCGLEVHHVQKRSAAKGLRLDPNNLVTLCGPDLHHHKDGCHKRTDWPYSKGRLVPTPLGDGRFEFAILYAKNKWERRAAGG